MSVSPPPKVRPSSNTSRAAFREINQSAKPTSTYSASMTETLPAKPASAPIPDLASDPKMTEDPPANPVPNPAGMTGNPPTVAEIPQGLQTQISDLIKEVQKLSDNSRFDNLAHIMTTFKSNLNEMLATLLTNLQSNKPPSIESQKGSLADISQTIMSAVGIVNEYIKSTISSTLETVQKTKSPENTSNIVFAALHLILGSLGAQKTQLETLLSRIPEDWKPSNIEYNKQPLLDLEKLKTDLTSAMQETATKVAEMTVSNMEIKGQIKDAFDEMKGQIKNALNEAKSPSQGALGMPININNNIDLASLAKTPTFKRNLAEVTEAMSEKDRMANLKKTIEEQLEQMKRGGHSQVQKGGESDVIKKAKEIRGKIDDIKKSLRNVTDGLSGIKDRFTKFQNIYKTSPTNTTYDLIEKLKTDLKPKTGLSTKEEVDADNARIKAVEKTALGMATAIKETGSKLVDDTTKFINEAKDTLRKTINGMDAILEDQPSNTTYVGKAQDLKNLIEGSFDDTSNSGLISRLDKMLSKISSDYEDVNGVVNSISSGIRETNKNEVERNKPIPGYYRQHGGILNVSNDAGDVNNDFEGFVAKIIDDINKKIITGILKPIDVDYMRRTNPVMSAALGAEPTMFQNIYQNYLDTKAKESPAIALNKLSDAVEANKLAPQDVLKITSMDKTVFVFVMLFIRLFAITTVEYMISKNWIKKLSMTLIAYMGFYSLYMVIFTAIVNIDIYRMRIVFNYVNLHANAGRIVTHIAFLWLFGFLFLVMIWHNAIPIKGITHSTLSSEIKADLMYRIEVLSMILWIFSFILVLLI